MEDLLLKKAEELKEIVNADMEKRSIAKGKLEAAMEGLKDLGLCDLEEAEKALKELAKKFDSVKAEAEEIVRKLEALVKQKDEKDA